MERDKNYKLGIMYGLGAYFIWGVLPLYWRQLQHVEAMEILASRFIWSAVFVGILLLAKGMLRQFITETKEIFSDFSSAWRMVFAAIVISFNWGIFIWAVEVGRIVETSMGYYINPLVSILLGMLVLKERLTKMQIIAVLWAVVGIAVIVVKNGSLPWVSVSLAVTFALYGLMKKIIKASAFTSIMLETLLISPLMLAYLYYYGSAYQTEDLRTLCLLAGAGVATAVPLLLFTACAQLLPLKIVGFMQYLAPTMTLLLGVFVYGEAFTVTHAVAFGCIWIGLGFFTISQISGN